MNKPRLEDFIKEIPWTDSQGKEHKAAGIDFASYAFALEKYVRELEKTVWTCVPISIDEISEVYQELRDRQRVIVFASKTEKEAEEKRKQALGYATKALSNILRKHGYPEKNL